MDAVEVIRIWPSSEQKDKNFSGTRIMSERGVTAEYMFHARHYTIKNNVAFQPVRISESGRQGEAFLAFKRPTRRSKDVLRCCLIAYFSFPIRLSRSECRWLHDPSIAHDVKDVDGGDKS